MSRAVIYATYNGEVVVDRQENMPRQKTVPIASGPIAFLDKLKVIAALLADRDGDRLLVPIFKQAKNDVEAMAAIAVFADNVAKMLPGAGRVTKKGGVRRH